MHFYSGWETWPAHPWQHCILVMLSRCSPCRFLFTFFIYSLNIILHSSQDLNMSTCWAESESGEMWSLNKTSLVLRCSHCVLSIIYLQKRGTDMLIYKHPNVLFFFSKKPKITSVKILHLRLIRLPHILSILSVCAEKASSFHTTHWHKMHIRPWRSPKLAVMSQNHTCKAYLRGAQKNSPCSGYESKAQWSSKINIKKKWRAALRIPLEFPHYNKWLILKWSSWWQMQHFYISCMDGSVKHSWVSVRKCVVHYWRYLWVCLKFNLMFW